MLVKRSAGTNGMKYRETLQAACRSYNRIRYRRGNNKANRSHTAKLERSKELGLSRRERAWNTTKQVHVLPSKLVKNIAHRIVDRKTFEKEIEDGVVMVACEESSMFMQSDSFSWNHSAMLGNFFRESGFCHFARPSAFEQAMYLFSVTGSMWQINVSLELLEVTTWKMATIFCDLCGPCLFCRCSRIYPFSNNGKCKLPTTAIKTLSFNKSNSFSSSAF